MKAKHGGYGVLTSAMLLGAGCTAPLPPAPPSGLAVTATSSSTLRLGWQDNSTDESAFIIERSSSGAGPFGRLARASADATWYDDDGLPPGTTYFYRVMAVGAGGASAAAGPVEATTPSADTRYRLTLRKDGTGAGGVMGTGIDCGDDCSEPFEAGASVTLTAAPVHGSTFAGWTGCDAPSDSSCTVTMRADRTVIATFSASATPALTLTVHKRGTGTGTVTAPGIWCGTDCTEPLPPGALVTLTATPDAGSTFTGWSGCDVSTSGPCTVTMSAATTVTASFELAPLAHVLTVHKSAAAGTAASGAILGTGIHCGHDCSEALAPHTTVTLTAAPSAGSILLGWSGCDWSTLDTCTVTMSAARTVTAELLGPYTYTGTTLAGLREISPALRFGALTVASALSLEPSDGASVTLRAASFTLPIGGSIRFSQGACSYAPPPELSILATGEISLSGGDLLLDGKAGLRESSSTTCGQCQGTRGGDLALQGATIELGSATISLSGGPGSTHTLPDGRFYGCDGGAGGHLTLAATGAVGTQRESLIAFGGGAGGGASSGLPAGLRGADGYSTMTGSVVRLWERGLPGDESNALVQSAQRLTHQAFTLAGAIDGLDDAGERGRSGTVVVSGPSWSDFCEDLYVIQARAAGRMTFSLAGSKGDLDLYLVDPGISTIYAHGNGPTANESFSYHGAAGDYVLCVSWVDGQPTPVPGPVGYSVTVGP